MLETLEATVQSKTFTDTQEARYFEARRIQSGFETWHYQIGQWFNSQTVVEWIEY